MTARRKGSVQVHEAIQTPLGMYAVCAGHGVVQATKELIDDVCSPIYPHRRALEAGLPTIGWTTRYNRERKEDDWYCPPCAHGLPVMPDESER